MSDNENDSDNPTQSQSDGQPEAEQSGGTVGQRSANPTPPEAEVLTSEDTHDSPQLPPQRNQD